MLAALAGHAVLWVGIVNRVHGVGMPRWLMDGVTHACVLAFGLLPLAWVALRWSNGLLLADPLTGGGPAAWYLVLCLLVAATGAAARVYATLHPERRGALLRHDRREIDLRQQLGPEAFAPGTPRRLATLPGNELVRPVLASKELRVPRLPAELDGYRIAHLSDLHMSGRVAMAYFQAVVDETLNTGADLIALTGDLVEFDPQHAWLDDTLLRLAAPDGVWFVLGNHDLRHDHAKLRRTLTAAGQFDLGGSAVDAELRGKRVRFVGNELPWFGPPGDPTGDGRPVDLTVCLAHGPDQFRWAQRHGADLILAGHNHGGQVRVPLLGAVVTPSIHGTRYAGGTFRRGRTVMHVSRGLGSLAPLRYNCPPELALLTLRPG